MSLLGDYGNVVQKVAGVGSVFMFMWMGTPENYVFAFYAGVFSLLIMVESPIPLPSDYGYVISAGVGATFMVIWTGIRVREAFKNYLYLQKTY